MGILGALRFSENVALEWEDFNRTDDHIIVSFTRLKKSEAAKKQTFFVPKNADLDLSVYHLYGEYLVRVQIPSLPVNDDRSLKT